MDKKLFHASDPKEIEEALAFDIYKELIVKANELNSYQGAVDYMQKRLEALITISPHNKALIKRAAEIAGDKFLKTVGEVKRQHQQFNIGIPSGVKFGNITITQHPPKNSGEIEYPGEVT